MIRSLLAIALAAAATSAALGQPEDHEAGRKVYNFRCYFCHGYSGDARTVAAAQLAPAPTDFTRADAARLDAARIEATLREGRPGTAMKSFAKVLSESEIRSVAAFVRREFVLARAPNTRYHTAENGWPDHERYAAAFPFATGAIPLDRPAASLDASAAEGRRLFLGACITCHDRGNDGAPGVAWEPRAVSYPPSPATCLNCHNREGVRPRPPGASGRALSPTYRGRSHPVDAGDPFSIHDRPPRIAKLSATERRGEKAYQSNCAFCHAADGTGRNWIGAFLEPHAADFTDPSRRARLDARAVAAVARDGVPGTSMPAWRSVLADRDIEAIAAYIERAFLRAPPRRAD